ncbi:MAG: hypothetical protein U9N42_04335 [Campylobacterota bacterium]|nr:hypothetical protein [Campylobacterota bacterium]
MRSANFVYFFTAQGFFVGLIFALLKADEPIELLTYTGLITLFFYTFSQFCIALYLRTLSGIRQFFPVSIHEKHLDSLMHEVNKRENLIDTTCKDQESLMSSPDPRNMLEEAS